MQLILANWHIVAAVALLATIGLPRVWPMVKGYLPSLKSLSSLVGPGEVTAEEWKRVRQHKAWNCPECREAIKVLNAHFLDEVVPQ